MLFGLKPIDPLTLALAAGGLTIIAMAASDIPAARAAGVADPGCTRIRQIPEIGPIVPTAIVVAIGNGAAFREGRDFAAWLGVVPRQ